MFRIMLTKVTGGRVAGYLRHDPRLRQQADGRATAGLNVQED